MASDMENSAAPEPSERGIAGLLRAMHDIVAREATAQERLDDLTVMIAGHVQSDVCSIYLRLPDDELELYASEGLKQEAVHKTRLAWGEGLVGQVGKTLRPLVTADAPLHPAFSYRPETGEDPLHSFLGVPLVRSGKALGVLVLQNKKSRRYGDEEIEAAQAVATLLAEIAASGELFDETTTRDVGAVLRRPDHVSGIGIVDGVAIGKVAFHDSPTPKHRVFSNDTGKELQRIDAALADLKASIDAMLEGSSLNEPGLGAAPREVLEAYRLFANDNGWRDRLRAAALTGLTAESAVEQVQNENRQRMGQIRDSYLRERLHDLDDLAYRLMRHLTGDTVPKDALPEEAILIARTMGPADLLEYDRARLKGLVVEDASATSHVAIVARALGVPLVAGVENALNLAEGGDAAVVDGETGDVHIRPTPDVLASYAQKKALLSEQRAAMFAEKGLPSVTKDGVAVELGMNAGLTVDMSHLAATGAAGVGLFRTELQFLIGNQLPRVSAQQKLYNEILDLAGGLPVVFRTADLGSDKSAEYMERPNEQNPAMGWRGVRMAVDRPGFLRPQLRALLGAGAGRRLSIMFPMVTVTDELAVARELLDREIELRERHGQKLPQSVSVGAMIETPAAAWRAAALGRLSDFLSIGGNDLAQFYFAADRESELVQGRYDVLDAGFLLFLKHIVDAVGARQTPLSYCGEQAVDAVTASALLAIGIRRFSLPAAAIGLIRRVVRSISIADAADWLTARLNESNGNLRQPFADYLRASGVVLES